MRFAILWLAVILYNLIVHRQLRKDDDIGLIRMAHTLLSIIVGLVVTIVLIFVHFSVKMST